MVGILGGQAFLGRRQTYLEKPGPQRTLSCDEGGTPGGAGLLSVVVRENGAFIGDAVDVGGAVTHHAAVVSADVPVADIIGHDDEDVWLLRLLRHGWRTCGKGGRSQGENA